MPKTSNEFTRVIFRAADLEPALLARTRHGDSLNATAKRDLDRYYALLALSLPRFTVAEASFLLDILNGTLTEPHTASLLWAQASDALDDGLAEKWQIADGPALVKRLRALTPFEALAVSDAVERAWIAISRDDATTDEAIHRVGLMRP